jgi:lipid-A-disaccharide synthase
MKKLFFITGELSGDIHAAKVLNELYKIIPPRDISVKAIGSVNLEKAGAEIFFDSKYLGSMGLTEVIKKLPLYAGLERELLSKLNTFLPDAVILVDFPGFNLRLAKKIKKLLPDTKVIYYLPPQVWAWNQARTKTLAKYCDLVLCGLPFEEQFHRERGVNAFYVGNPLIHEVESLDREKTRNEFGTKKDDILIGLFPGSRNSEIKYMFPVLLKSVELLKSINKNCTFMIAQAQTVNSLESEIKKSSKGNGDLSKKLKILPPGNNHKLLCASDIVWLTSGTVTLEAALYETPMILGYKGNQINYLLYLLVKRINMIGLPNIIANKEIVPELLQNNAKPENYMKLTDLWLKKHQELEQVKDNLKKVKETLGTKNASKETAERIAKLIIKRAF